MIFTGYRRPEANHVLGHLANVALLERERRFFCGTSDFQGKIMALRPQG